MYDNRYNNFLLPILISMLFIWPGIAFAQQDKQTAETQTTDTGKAEAEEQVQTEKTGKTTEAKQENKSESSKEDGEAPFVDRDGDGINDAMEYRFRRGKRNQRRNGDGTRQRYMKGRGKQGAQDGTGQNGSRQGSSSGNENSQGNSSGN